MHGNGSNKTFLELEYCEIRDTIVAEESLQVPAWSALLKQPSSRRRLFLSCGVQAFGQLSGINVVNYYGYVIYAILGISTETSLMIVSISSALSIIYCSARLYLLDRVSRVNLLLASSVGCGLSLMVNAVLSQYYVTDVGTSNANENALRAMVAMNFVFSLFLTFIGIISWVYPAEIFPVEIRAKGNSFSTLTNQCLNLLFAQTAPIALEKMGFKFFYFFFVFNIIVTVCYALFYPETKGRTLEQMDELFGDQLVSHALKDSTGAEAALDEKSPIEHVDAVE